LEEQKLDSNAVNETKPSQFTKALRKNSNDHKLKKKAESLNITPSQIIQAPRKDCNNRLNEYNARIKKKIEDGARSNISHRKARGNIPMSSYDAKLQQKLDRQIRGQD